MKIYAIASTEHRDRRDRVYHEYVLVELTRIDKILFWIPCQDFTLKNNFKHETPLLSLETIQKKYNYTYIGYVKYGRRPYKEGDLEISPEL